MPGDDAAAEPGRPNAAPLMPVADQLLFAVSVVAPDSTLLYTNAAAAHAIGQEPAWLIGRRMLDLVHPDDRARVRRELRHLASGRLASGRPSGGSTTYRLRAGPKEEWRVFESMADNLLDDASIGGILVSSRDVTDRESPRARSVRRRLSRPAHRAAKPVEDQQRPPSAHGQRDRPGRGLRGHRSLQLHQ